MEEPIYDLTYLFWLLLEINDGDLPRDCLSIIAEYGIIIDFIIRRTERDTKRALTSGMAKYELENINVTNIFSEMTTREWLSIYHGSLVIALEEVSSRRICCERERKKSRSMMSERIQIMKGNVILFTCHRSIDYTVVGPRGEVIYTMI